MDRATRDALVAKYKDGYVQVASALEGATDAGARSPAGA